MFTALILVTTGASARGGEEPLKVPAGAEPAIDGLAGPGEWKGALEAEAEGVRVLLLHGETHLFVRIEAKGEGRLESGAIHLRIPPLTRPEFPFPHDRRALLEAERFLLLEASGAGEGLQLRDFLRARFHGRWEPSRRKAGKSVPAETAERRAGFEKANGWVAAAGMSEGKPFLEFRISFWLLGVDPCTGRPEGFGMAAGLRTGSAEGPGVSASWPAGEGKSKPLDPARPWRGEGVLEAAVASKDGWSRPPWPEPSWRLRSGTLRFSLTCEAPLAALAGEGLQARIREEAKRILSERLKTVLEGESLASASKAAVQALEPVEHAVRVEAFKPGPPGESPASARAIRTLRLQRAIGGLDDALRIRAWNALAEFAPGKRYAGKKRACKGFDVSLDGVPGPSLGYHLLTLYEKDGRIRAQMLAESGIWTVSEDRIVVVIDALAGCLVSTEPQPLIGFVMYDQDGREVVRRNDFESLHGNCVQVHGNRFFFLSGLGTFVFDRDGKEPFHLPNADALESKGGYLVTQAWTDPGRLIRVFSDEGRALGEHRTRNRARIESFLKGEALVLRVDGKEIVFRK
jgi:hypothetical protein